MQKMFSPNDRVKIAREFFTANKAAKPAILRKYKLSSGSAIRNWVDRGLVKVETVISHGLSSPERNELGRMGLDIEAPHDALAKVAAMTTLDYCCSWAECPEYPITVTLCEECGARFSCASHLQFVRYTEQQLRHTRAPNRRSKCATFILTTPDED